ncbi:hypothetical protein DPMN_078396 [Dreissena polymorpha]|uniref:Uncharacterized protein n=1 Tax=Dreissena polymorpha TaxID=45954 RepID=A0A9D3YRR2_DREPO|nr:hypothetical protein DPMN_078396 [Dreissena polymorpha]
MCPLEVRYLNRRQRQQDGFEDRLGRKMTNQKKDSSRNYLLKRTHNEAKTSGTRELEKEKKSNRKKKYVPAKNVPIIKPSQKRSHEKKCTRLQQTKENVLTSPLKTIQKCGYTASGNVGHFDCKLVAGKRPGLLLS